MKQSSTSIKSIISGIGIGIVAVFIIIAFSHNVLAQYTGIGNHVVSLTNAQAYIQHYRNNPVAPTNKAVYFERNIYDKILAQPGCVGIRQYFAQDGTAGVTLVLVGVDAKGNDLINGIIGEAAALCPPLCPSDTKLY
jgi:hypothetical protein